MASFKPLAAIFCLSGLIWQVSPSHSSDMGVAGLIDMPSARMRADGALTTSATRQDSVSVYNLTYQGAPWLEMTFRYAVFRDFNFADRSYEAKLLLKKEDELWPQLAVGVRDILGTGAYAGEYAVASKQFGPVDISLGLGWGRLAGAGRFKNPLRLLSESYGARSRDIGLGGELEADTFFRGREVGVFGGIDYQLPNQKTRVVAEYNPDLYSRETRGGAEPPKTELSYGVYHEFLPGLSLGASYQHGTEFGLHISAVLNTKQAVPRFRTYAPRLAQSWSDDESPKGYDFSTWQGRLGYDLKNHGITLKGAEVSGNRARIRIANGRFPLWNDAIAKAFVAADMNLPRDIEYIDMVADEFGHAVLNVSSRRFNATQQSYHATFASQIDLLPAPQDPPKKYAALDLTPLNLSFGLSHRVHLFDPDYPFANQIYAKIGAAVPLGSHLSFKASYAQDIWNEFDNLTRKTNSTLDIVRSDTGEYLKYGQSGIEKFYFDYRNSFGRNFHYRGYAGMLEDMFSGIGGEVLYQPHAKTYAFSVSGNVVKKRDYDRSFKHRDLETHTAFVSAFWATPFYNYDAALHVGQYLAGDRGATLQIRRVFDNGFSIGAFATLTNVSAEEFGEGSFDKGLFFKIPLWSVFNKNMRPAYSTRIRSIQRDGGQRLENHSGQLWFDLRDVHYGVLDRNRDRMLP